MVAGPVSGIEVFGSPGLVVGSPPPGAVISVSVEPLPGFSGVVGFSPPLSPGPTPPPGFASVGSTGGVASVSGSVGHHAGGSGSVTPGMVGQLGEVGVVVGGVVVVSVFGIGAGGSVY
ncbi:hypothetical protein GCM10020255_065650 [Rhodococcus baikonurensis]